MEQYEQVLSKCVGTKEYKKLATKKFYDKHPEKRTEREYCNLCNVHYLKLGKTNHFKTKKHRDAEINNVVQNNINEQMEELRKENEELKEKIRELNYALEDPKRNEQRKQIKMKFYESLKV